MIAGSSSPTLIGSAPVQYGSIKAMALSYMGRFDEVDAAIAEEVTDDDHPFGQVMASLARSVHLVNLGAWGPAAVSLAETLEGATAMSRVRFQLWAGSLLAVVAAQCRAEAAGEVPDPDAIPSFGSWRGGLTAAQVALADGDPERALALGVAAPADRRRTSGCATTSPSSTSSARAQLALGESRRRARCGDARDRARRTDGASARSSGGCGQCAPSPWPGSVGAEDARARSRRRPPQTVALLAARITDPELRAWFERQASSFEISPSSRQ